MNVITRIILLSYLIFNLSIGPSFAVDTASLLPNAVQQFFDNNGNPLTSGKVTTYAAGTSTLKTTWKDSAETLPNTNPITLDAGGKAIIYGSGNYRQVVKDRNGNLIWDAVTAPGGGGSSPTSVGDGNLVGTILPWSGLVAPSQYVFAYGQEISRSGFPEYYTAVTQQLNVICTSASNILTGLADTTQIKLGSSVELPLCVVAGTTVTAKTPATITLSNPSSVSINSVATFFPWGNGNGSTTFNVPDFRGYALIGRDNMGGSSAGRISTANCLASITPDALGAVCGSDKHTLLVAELATHNHNATSVSTVTNGLEGANSGVNITTGGPQVVPATPATIVVSTATTIDNTGSSTPFSIIQPSITLNYIAKVTPDTSTSIATGVYSIGGMSGIIACGTGILCTGNTISFNSSTFAAGAITQIQYNGGIGGFAASPNFTFISPDNLTLGAAGTFSKFDIFGSTSGRVRQTIPAIAGTTNIAWGNTSGTPAVTATSPLIISSTTGNINISPDALSRINDTNVTLTLGGGASTAVISPTSLTLGWSGQLAVSRGGTGLSTCPTATTVVHGGATTLSCSQIVNGDITTNTIANASLAQGAAATFKGNPTAALANVQDFTIASLTQTISPGTLDFIPIFDNSTGTLKKVNANSIAVSATAGVASLNSLVNALTLNVAPGLNIASAGTTITITPDTATTANFEAGTTNKLLDANVVFTPETTTTFGTTTALDFNTFINTKVTLTGNITTMNCSNMKQGQAGTVAFIQDGTGSRTAAFSSGTCSSTLKFANATFPTLTISASAIDILSYSCRSSTYCVAGLSKGYNP